MERPCAYPGCTTTLSKLVPLQITLCGKHRYRLKKLKENLDSEQLPKKDIRFIFAHPKGCNTRQLALRLGINPTTMLGYLKRGVIKGEKKEDPPVWQIPAEEIKRVIILVRNWVTVRKASRDIRVEKTTLLAYVRQGYFGPSQIHLCGGLAIRKEELPGLREKYERIKREVRANQRYWFARELKKDEMTSNQIARSLSMTNEGIRWWTKKGWLACQKRKGRLVIKTRDFAEFAQRAINGEFSLHPRTKKALEEFILTQGPP